MRRYFLQLCNFLRWFKLNQISDQIVVTLITLIIPIFFPLVFTGKMPGPFAKKITDTYIFMEPYALHFINALKSGQIPFWNDLSSLGAPTPLVLATGALHPFHLFYLLFPSWLAYALALWARIALFSVFSYLFLRGKGVRIWLAFCFSIGITFGSWFLNYSLEIIGYVMAFFPMALYFSDRLMIMPKKRYFVFLAIAVSSLILGGFLSVILYALIVLGVYVILSARNKRAFLLAASAIISGCLLVLPLVIETLIFYPEAGYSSSQRAGLFNYTPPSYVSLNLLSPAPYGGLLEYYTYDQRDFFGRLLGAGPISFSLATLGLLLILFSRPFRQNQQVVIWGAVLVVCLVIYFDIFSIKAILSYIPIINEHPLTRLQAFIAIASAYLAALTAEFVLQNRQNRNLNILIRMGLNLILLISVVLPFLMLPKPFSSENVIYFATLAALSSFAFLINNKRYREISRRITIIGFLATALLSVHTFFYYYEKSDYYPKSKLITTIQSRLIPGARILDVNNILFGGTAMAYGIPSITNHWFLNKNLRERITHLGDNQITPGLTLDTVPSINPTTVWPELRSLHIQFLIVPLAAFDSWPYKTSTDWELLEVENGIALVAVKYSTATENRPTLSGFGYDQYSQKNGNIYFQPKTDGWIEIPVRMYRGWEIARGATLLRASNTNLIEVLPEKIQEQVHLEYRPKYFLPLMLIGPTCLLLFLFLFFSTNYHAKQSEEP